MDQALLIFHNQLTEEVHASYTSDYCYKVKNIHRHCGFIKTQHQQENRFQFLKKFIVTQTDLSKHTDAVKLNIVIHCEVVVKFHTREMCDFLSFVIK